jgi:adenosylcobinamide-GDP ribazoletransferase
MPFLPTSDRPSDLAGASPLPWTTPPWLRGARAAVVFLTRVPLGGFPYRDADWRWASAWFPPVGAAVGALAGGAFFVGHGAGALVAGTLAVLASVLLTGALHEDGLADTADALGGSHQRERVLAILKDSRIGTYGAAALILSLLLRVFLLARLERSAPAALVAVAAWSRAAPVWLMASLPYVTAPESARNRALVGVGGAQVLIATAFAIVITPLVLPGLREVIGLVVVTAALGLGCGWRFRARVGGITGDFLGATQQVCECGLLLWLTLVGAGPHAPW